MDDEQPKRSGPQPVEPVVIDKIRHEVARGAKARGFGQDGGVVAAVDPVTDKAIWTLVVYKTAYDDAEEADVQERYITRLAVENGGTLRVENESRKTHRVNVKTREVTEAAP